MSSKEEVTPAEKAFAVLKRNLNVWDLKDLIELLEAHLEEKSQEMMKYEVPLKELPDER